MHTTVDYDGDISLADSFVIVVWCGYHSPCAILHYLHNTFQQHELDAMPAHQLGYCNLHCSPFEPPWLTEPLSFDG